MPEPDLTDKLYAAVQRTRPLLRNITARVEADLKGTGISVGQRAVLEVLLYAGPCTAPEITRALEVTRQFVARELKDMAARGLVSVAENPRRKRSGLYQLTETSRRDIQAIRDRETATLKAFAQQFTPEEIEAFCKVQEALSDQINNG